MLFGHQNNSTGTMPAGDITAPEDLISTDTDTAPLTDNIPAATVPTVSPVAPPAPQPDAPVPQPAPVAPPAVPSATAPIQPAAVGLPHELLELKQRALGELTPLVSHLQQSPEEKFRTTMMMIQSTDNQDLIKDAYAAAQAITDDKARAQALLDVVNEINYFTQQSANK